MSGPGRIVAVDTRAKLAEIRKRLGATLDEVAREIPIHYATLYRWEGGGILVVSDRNLRRWRKALEVVARRKSARERRVEEWVESIRSA